MDKIRIENLEIFAKHGVFPEENFLGQKFVLSAVLHTDTRKAGLTDELSYSVHYGEVSHLIKKVVEENTWKLLETVAEAVHYSKYHLHRMFTETVGMTLHDYVQRRRLTEAAKLLAFSRRPISQIALQCGYESQQSFSQAFKSMYKAPPAAYRAAGNFYPLQLPFTLRMERGREAFRKEEIRLAEERDIPAWMELMRLVIDGYPAMDEGAYLEQLRESIRAGHALVLGEGDTLAGALVFSTGPGRIEFLGVHPQYRRRGLQRLFLDVLTETCLPDQEISTTTYRERDRADTGHRALLLELGFAQRELLTEFGYPTQRLVLLPRGEEGRDDR